MDENPYKAPKASRWLRFTIRELLLATIIVALGIVVGMEHWPLGTEPRMSQKELAVYAAAIRETIERHGVDGKIFVSVADADPPRKLLGLVLLPVSACHMAKGIAGPEEPELRVRERLTGDPGSIIEVRILRWLSTHHVEVKCKSYTAGDWAGGSTIRLRLKDGRWQFDGENEGEYWTS